MLRLDIATNVLVPVSSTTLTQANVLERSNLQAAFVDQSPEAEQSLQTRLGGAISFQKWGSETSKNSGFTFKIETEAQFAAFLSAVSETAT